MCRIKNICEIILNLKFAQKTPENWWLLNVFADVLFYVRAFFLSTTWAIFHHAVDVSNHFLKQNKKNIANISEHASFFLM